MESSRRQSTPESSEPKQVFSGHTKVDAEMPRGMGSGLQVVLEETASVSGFASDFTPLHTGGVAHGLVGVPAAASQDGADLTGTGPSPIPPSPTPFRFARGFSGVPSPDMFHMTVSVPSSATVSPAPFGGSSPSPFGYGASIGGGVMAPVGGGVVGSIGGGSIVSPSMKAITEAEQERKNRERKRKMAAKPVFNVTKAASKPGTKTTIGACACVCAGVRPGFHTCSSPTEHDATKRLIAQATAASAFRECV